MILQTEVFASTQKKKNKEDMVKQIKIYKRHDSMLMLRVICVQRVQLPDALVACVYSVNYH